MAIRIIGTSVGAPVAVLAASSGSSPSASARSLAANRCGHNRSTAKAKQAIGTATLPRPKIAPVPSASPDPTGPARSEVSPRVHSTPSTISAIAATSPQWPSSWRPAAARLRATIPGSRRRAAGTSGGRLPLRRHCGRLVAWGATPRRGRRHPRTLTLVTRATAASCVPSRPPTAVGARLPPHAGPDRLPRRPGAAERRDQTSITTGMMAGRRRVRSLMNLPSERRAWRRRVSKSMAPSSAASWSDARTAAFASSSSSSASGA